MLLMLKQQIKLLNKKIRDLENQLAARSGYKGHLQRQTSEYWEEKYWELAKQWTKLNTPMYKLLEEGLEYPTKDTRGPLELAKYIQDHYYAVLSNRNVNKNNYANTFLLATMRAVELLREYARIRMDKVSEDTVEDTPEETKDNVVSLRLLSGGKGGSEHNWLIDLPVGSVFMCKKKETNAPEFLAMQFFIDWKGTRAVLLSSTIPSRIEIPVDSVGFCKTHDLIEVQRKGHDHGTTD